MRDDPSAAEARAWGRRSAASTWPPETHPTSASPLAEIAAATACEESIGSSRWAPLKPPPARRTAARATHAPVLEHPSNAST